MKKYKGEQRKTFDVQYILANEPAFLKNSRYIDEDLNRGFNVVKLEKSNEKTAKNTEEKIALELDAKLGPKSRRNGSNTNVDFTIDVHSSTSNIGVCLMTQAEDSIALRVAHFVKTNIMKDLKIYVWKESKAEGYSVDSISHR